MNRSQVTFKLYLPWLRQLSNYLLTQTYTTYDNVMNKVKIW
jgi:hypothetical protein